MLKRSTYEERQAREAAESLLGSSTSLHPAPSTDISINTVLSDVIPPGDIVTGLRPGGRMSVVRRFFCLFVTFDLLFTILMWLICIMLISEDVFKMMSEQIVHYNIRTSLFDIVMAAVTRFVILLLFYGLLYVNHWCFIALTTAGTCSFLIAKVFLYNWVCANSPVLQVLLIITSFVISWGEAWFLDFRVIPQEVVAKDIMRNQSAVHERTPLLQNFLQNIVARQDDQPESVRNFYSPLDSPAASDNEDEPPETTLRHSSRRQMIADSYSLVREAVTSAQHSLMASNWRQEKKGKNGDVVKSRPRPSRGKMYRLEGQVSLPPIQLLHLLFHELDDFPKWNPALTTAYRLEVIDEQTDISYQVSAEEGGGLVAPREFVTLRHWEQKGNIITLVFVSTSHPAAPPNPKIVRAQQAPSGWVLEPGESPGSTRLQWLLDTDMRGWVPQALLDQAFANSMLQSMEYLRIYIASLDSHPTTSTRVR